MQVRQSRRRTKYSELHHPLMPPVSILFSLSQTCKNMESECGTGLPYITMVGSRCQNSTGRANEPCTSEVSSSPPTPPICLQTSHITIPSLAHCTLPDPYCSRSSDTIDNRMWACILHPNSSPISYISLLFNPLLTAGWPAPYSNVPRATPLWDELPVHSAHALGIPARVRVKTILAGCYSGTQMSQVPHR